MRIPNVPFRTLFSFILLIMAAGCADDVPQRPGSPYGAEEPDQILTDTRMELTESGKTTAVIEARTVRIFEDRNFASLEDSVKIEFFDKKGEHTTTMTARTGEIWGLYEETDSLRASGDVIVRAEENNAFLQAPAIRWIVSEGIVYGDGLVRLNSDNGYEEGTGFEARDDLSEYRFRGPVSGEVRGSGADVLRR